MFGIKKKLYLIFDEEGEQKWIEDIDINSIQATFYGEIENIFPHGIGIIDFVNVMRSLILNIAQHVEKEINRNSIENEKKIYRWKKICKRIKI